MKKILLILLCSFMLNACATQNKVYFTPSLDCENNIVHSIDTAETLDVAIYSLNNTAIVAAIKRAHDRGAKIRILTDKLQASGRYSKVKELYDYGVNIRVHSKHKIEHNKFAIFDKKTVVTGSYNWTNAASRTNSENCALLPDKESVQEYQKRFDFLWRVNTAEKSNNWFLVE